MLHTFKSAGGEVKAESLKINRADGEIKGTVSCFSYKDKDTGQYVLYCPSFEVSGYGETKGKAEEMFNFSLEEFLRFLIESKAESMQSELGKLGWTCRLPQSSPI